MRGFISTSRFLAPLFLVFLVTLGTASYARADANDPGGRTDQPEEDDFSGSPYTDYGEFNNQEAEEEADTRFFQYGRFFGISLGVGTETVTGNRGALWQGGFPTLEFKLHYWFDFNFAMTLDVYSAHHFYDSPDPNVGHTDVNFVHLGIELKYYFDVKNLSSTISFANPYITAGVGPYTKTETSVAIGAPDTDTSIGFSVGAGLEFPVSPKKVYFEFEARMHVVNFKDTSSSDLAAPPPAGLSLPDLGGQWVTLTGGILFTW
jgi:opacity protein-like surface antigen